MNQRTLRQRDYQRLIDGGFVEVQGDVVVVDERLVQYLPVIRLNNAFRDLSISPTSLAQGFRNNVYSDTVAASGGNAPYTYALTEGTLPVGLSLNANTGAITGTPTAAAASYPITITATDASGTEEGRRYTLAVVEIVLSPTSVPAGQEGVAYSQQLSAAGGTGPYTYAVTVGPLPTGITLSGAGLLAGTPSVNGTFPLTIRATDANGKTGTRVYSLVLAAP